MYIVYTLPPPILAGTAALSIRIEGLILHTTGEKNTQKGNEGLARTSDIDSTESIPSEINSELEFLNNLWGARNRVGIGLSYRTARLHRLAEFIPWNRFLGSINV
jgi:hypothetical protein